MDGNLTKGPILNTLTKLAIPIMASYFIGTLYNITDMAWIGQLGSKAVAGVGVGGMFTWLSQGLSSIARMGGQVQVAQCIGRGDREKAHGYAQVAIQLAFYMGLIFALISLIFVHQMVGFFNLTDPEAYSAAVSYTRIACGLIVFSFLTVTLTGLYTAQGDSQTPFWANLIGLATNMILDPILILGPGPFPKLGVIGAAIATVTAQFIVMGIMVLGVMRQKKENVLKGIRLAAVIPGSYLKGICQIGIPSGIQDMTYCFISMILTRMVSGFGAEALATQRVGGQIESISWHTADGFAAALNAFTAQNYGAGKMDRVKKGYRASLLTVGVWGLLVTAIFVFAPNTIARIFFHEPKAIAIAVSYLIIIGLSEAFLCVEITTIGAISGLGKTHLCSIISILFTSMRIPLAIVLGNTSLGLDGIWWALSSTSMIKGIIFTATFFWITRRKKA
ncbi:Staphylococcal virulence regulator protein A [uncultured Clostridium sp.]|uniref:Probable multidrug resistance protein NorM n=1 Tax=Muricoprocola aceti TaxID=2981772 RepID=A0ABT2SNU8_9FIRM|nr:MATE family efflux transporter [Muricoprocola aceti]MCU6725925.1 MATE family efflux transporter [Muricoprocola aceti]MDD7435645.1 MATE family efflux transporter [Lachnospiraceae bacterium]SCH70161.1 Staphylococcal virulence regulator protein A [uncultured Clostridium sp.]